VCRCEEVAESFEDVEEAVSLEARVGICKVSNGLIEEAVVDLVSVVDEEDDPRDGEELRI
jgi:hypothetical protein